MMTLATIALCALLLGLGVFQLLLAAGAPLGHFAWGGQHRVLPAQFRLGSVVSTAIYVAFAVVVLSRAGIVSLFPDQFARVGTWVIAGVLLLGVLPNLVSRSLQERSVMAPLALVMSALSAMTALG